MEIRLIYQIQLLYQFRDKFKLRCIARREPLLLYIMLKQGMMWFSLENNNENTISETA